MKPSIGRAVHFVNTGVHYAATIVFVRDGGYVNLAVLPNGETDLNFFDGRIKTIVSVRYSETPMHYTWHWPERED